MRELIIGASGLIGSHLYREAARNGEAVMGTYCGRPGSDLTFLDLSNDADLDRILQEFDPNVVYLPAAIPNVDWVESNPDLAKRINVDSPLRLIELLRHSGVKLVYYSSDYVFNGQDGPYSEEDGPDPVNEYGWQKLRVEEAIQSNLTDWLVLRVTVAYGWERQPKNFAHRLVNQLRAGESVRVPSDQFGNPTYAPNLSQATRELVSIKARGIFHLAGETRVARYEFAREIARVFVLPEDRVLPVTTVDLNQTARRPLNAGMIVKKAQGLLKTPLLGHRPGLLRMREEEGGYFGER